MTRPTSLAPASSSASIPKDGSRWTGDTSDRRMSRPRLIPTSVKTSMRRPPRVTRPALLCSARRSAGHQAETEEDDEDVAKPLPDRLIIELTAHRTLALRDALAENPATTF